MFIIPGPRGKRMVNLPAHLPADREEFLEHDFRVKSALRMIAHTAGIPRSEWIRQITANRPWPRINPPFTRPEAENILKKARESAIVLELPRYVSQLANSSGGAYPLTTFHFQAAIEEHNAPRLANSFPDHRMLIIPENDEEPLIGVTVREFDTLKKKQFHRGMIYIPLPGKGLHYVGPKYRRDYGNRQSPIDVGLDIALQEGMKAAKIGIIYASKEDGEIISPGLKDLVRITGAPHFNLILKDLKFLEPWVSWLQARNIPS